MCQYLSSVQHIVGQQAVVRARPGADTASVPTSFLEELEALRQKVEELSDEVKCSEYPLKLSLPTADSFFFTAGQASVRAQ